MITAGRVTVNGAVVQVLGTKVDADRDAVAVDGQAVTILDHFYVLLNKPKGCITAVTDDRGRPTVMDYLPNVPGVPVKPVGRLDFYTGGRLALDQRRQRLAGTADSRRTVATYRRRITRRFTASSTTIT